MLRGATMAKWRNDATEQFSLDLTPEMTEVGYATEAPRSRNVVSFTDANTLAVRREAIRRVKLSGIFTPPTGQRRMQG